MQKGDSEESPLCDRLCHPAEFRLWAGPASDYRAVPVDVVSRNAQKRRIVLESAEAVIAGVAQQLTNDLCRVVVVDVQTTRSSDAARWGRATDGAKPVLAGQHLVMSFWRDAISKK